jgi:hypothetical protein
VGKGSVLTVAALVLLAACAGPAVQQPREATGSSPGTPTPLVDPDEIVSGGPPPDGIPAIDDPKFQNPAEVDWLHPREPVLSLELNGEVHAYPIQILMWHEIVNDVVGGVPVAVTYCPLCNTGVAFKRPTVNGQLLDFGTSGKLYKSNLVMYDRQTRSYWPQVTGQAVMGPLTGMQLEIIPVQMVAWSDWLAQYPDGAVLSRETGHSRPYGANPYEYYDHPSSSPFLFQGELDRRLPPMARVVGVRVGSDVVAFPYEALRNRAVGQWAAVNTTVGGRPIVVLWKDGAASPLDNPVIALGRTVGATGTFDRVLEGRTLTFRATSEGVTDEQTGSRWDILGRAVAGPLQGTQLNRIVAVESFWFDWASFFPDTSIFGED